MKILYSRIDTQPHLSKPQAEGLYNGKTLLMNIYSIGAVGGVLL